MKSKFLKIVSAVLAIVMVCAAFAGCSKEKAEGSSSMASVEPKTKINVAVLKGPTAIGMLKLMSDNKNKVANNDYTFEVCTDPATQVVPKIINKSIDIAAVPTNLAATLYKKTEKNVSIIAVNTLGVLSIVTNGVEINSVADLKGKTIYATGQGSTPEYALNYILEKNGLKVGQDVTVEYKAEHSELATLMVSGEVKIAMLPQPFVTNVLNQNENVKVAIDLSDEWAKIPDNNGSELVMGCIIVRNDFLKENTEAVKSFLREYNASTFNANDKFSETGILADEFGILSAKVVEQSIPSCNIVCYTGEKMKTNVSAYLQTLLAANPASIGGELPDDAFYFLP